MLTLILGGIKSGKSRTAAALARGAVTFVATGQPVDAEMAARIAEHRRLRPAGWRTVEEPLHVGRVEGDTVILDSVDNLVANWLLAGGGAREAEAEVAALRARHLVAVSCEVGLAPVALSPLGRAFQDALGRVNQALAARAERVLFCVAGIPLEIKPGPVRPLAP